MPVDQASYRPYEGERRPGKGVALAIAGTLIRKMQRQRAVKFFIYLMPLFVSGIAGFVFALMYMNPQIFRILRQLGGDVNLLVLANIQFQAIVGFFALLIAAIVGGPLVAEDRRARALPLYFSRPITHLQYVLGKLFTIWFFMGALLLLPPIMMFVIEVSMNPADGILWDQVPVLLHSMVPGIMRILPIAAIALGLSAMMDRSNHATLLILGVFLPFRFVAEILARNVFEDPAWFALYPGFAVDAITFHFLPPPEKYTIASTVPPLGAAWASLWIWTAAGVALVYLRIRKVEVVT